MSYILNALRKSEQERRNKASETLQHRIAEIQPRGHTRSTSLVPPLIAINVALLGYFIWDHYRQIPSGATQEKVLAQDAQQSLKEKNGPTASPIRATPVKPELLVQQQQVPKIETPMKRKPVPVVETREESTEIQPVALVNKARQAPTEPAGKPKPDVEPSITAVEEPSSFLESKPERIEQKAIREQQEPGTSAGSMPYVSELSYEFQRRLPDFNINVYVFSERAADSFVMIDMKKYRVGQMILGQVELREIGPDSMVVRYEDQTFKIRRP